MNNASSPRVGELDALRPITDYLPARSARWIADAARAGRLAGAVKVARTWCWTSSDYRAWLATAQGRAPAPPTSGVCLDPDALPTLEQATADLRARGLIA